MTIILTQVANNANPSKAFINLNQLFIHALPDHIVKLKKHNP